MRGFPHTPPLSDIEKRGGILIIAFYLVLISILEQIVYSSGVYILPEEFQLAEFKVFF